MRAAALAAFVAFTLVAQVAAAHRIDHCDPPSTPQGPAPSLQEILDGLVVSGPAIDADAPAPIELWQNSAGPLTAQLVTDYTTKSQDVLFGIYDPDTMAKSFLLSDAMSPEDVATVVFRADHSIKVSGGVKNGTKSGFEGPFGFFVKTFTQDDEGEQRGKHGWKRHGKYGWKHHGGKHHGKPHIRDAVYYYTQLALNDGPRAKVFQGDGTTVLQLPGLAPGLFLPSQFLIAWETGLGDANDSQFNDFLVLVSNIVPATVPEPAFAFLLGISALALIRGRVRAAPK